MHQDFTKYPSRPKCPFHAVRIVAKMDISRVTALKNESQYFRRGAKNTVACLTKQSYDTCMWYAFPLCSSVLHYFLRIFCFEIACTTLHLNLYCVGI